MVARSWGREHGERLFNGCGRPLGEDENVLELESGWPYDIEMY